MPRNQIMQQFLVLVSDSHQVCFPASSTPTIDRGLFEAHTIVSAVSAPLHEPECVEGLALRFDEETRF